MCLINSANPNRRKKETEKEDKKKNQQTMHFIVS